MAFSSKDCDVTKGSNGQKIVRSFGRDDSSFPVNEGEARNGRKMGGGTTYIGHSLSGASAVQTGTGAGGEK